MTQSADATLITLSKKFSYHSLHNLTANVNCHTSDMMQIWQYVKRFIININTNPIFLKP